MSISYFDIIDAEKKLRKSGYEPDTLYVSKQALDALSGDDSVEAGVKRGTIDGMQGLVIEESDKAPVNGAVLSDTDYYYDDESEVVIDP